MSNAIKLTAKKRKPYSDRDLAMELCITSLCFTDLNAGDEVGNDEFEGQVEDDFQLYERPNKSTDQIVVEEALRYIGGYIVKQFSLKYPNLV